MTQQISTEEFIRSRAAMNWSKTMVRQALQVSDYSFREMCRLMPDVKWPSRNEGVCWREAKANSRGHSTPELRRAAAAARMARYANARQLTAGSFTGSVTQHIHYWGPLITVKPVTIRRRLKKGMSDLDALFLSSSDTLVDYPTNWRTSK